MIPLRDENPSRATPVVTYLLIGLNVLMFIWQSITPPREVAQYLMVPAALFHGGAYGYGHIHAAVPVYLTIFTSMFMHANLMHIGGNMLYLWIFGDNVEDMLGHFRYLVFYLGCGVIAALAHALSAPNSAVPTLGASGAIAGVLGAYFVTHGSAKVLSIVTLGFFWQTVWLPAWLVLGGWFALQVLNQTVLMSSRQAGGVAYMAHIGGFVGGIALFYLLGGGAASKAPVRRDGWGEQGRGWR
jgi:membrane associated rhomboid family serine protease